MIIAQMNMAIRTNYQMCWSDLHDTHSISKRKIYDVWEEYIRQKNKDTEIFSMLSKDHDKKMRRIENGDHLHREHFFRPRYDDRGIEYSIEDIVEIIAKINRECNYEAPVRQLSAEIALRTDGHLRIPIR